MGRRRSTTSRARSSRRVSRTTSSVKPTGKAYLTDTMIDAIVKEVYERLTLEDIGLTINELREVLQPVIESIVEQYSSRPSKDQVVARILRHQDKLLELISSYLLETREELNEAQLEFVVYNGGLTIARYAPRLYRQAKKLGREDLIDVLRGRWVEAGLATPFLCPYCGFYAVTPELTCIVCGADIDERVFKDSIGFSDLLSEFVASASPSEIKEVLRERRVAYDGQGLKAPSSARQGHDIVLHLDERDIRLIKSFLERGRESNA